eukprot:1145586-Pelagomonas_calceolata.AAC.1
MQLLRVQASALWKALDSRGNVHMHSSLKCNILFGEVAAQGNGNPVYPGHHRENHIRESDYFLAHLIMLHTQQDVTQAFQIVILFLHLSRGGRKPRGIGGSISITVNEHGEEEDDLVEMNEAAGFVPEAEKKALMQEAAVSEVSCVFRLTSARSSCIFEIPHVSVLLKDDRFHGTSKLPPAAATAAGAGRPSAAAAGFEAGAVARAAVSGVGAPEGRGKRPKKAGKDSTPSIKPAPPSSAPSSKVGGSSCSKGAGPFAADGADAGRGSGLPVGSGGGLNGADGEGSDDLEAFCGTGKGDLGARPVHMGAKGSSRGGRKGAQAQSRGSTAASVAVEHDQQQGMAHHEKDESCPLLRGVHFRSLEMHCEQ